MFTTKSSPALRRLLIAIPEGSSKLGLDVSPSFSRRESTLSSASTKSSLGPRFLKTSSSSSLSGMAANSPVALAPSPLASPAAAGGVGSVGARSSTIEWKKLYNQTADQCVWPLPPPSKATKTCDFPFKENPVTENVQVVTLPAGTELFHATTIWPKQKRWFTDMTSFNTLPGEVMWFASSPEHAKHMNFTHLLKFITTKDSKLLFIRNLLKDMGSNTGKDLLNNPVFRRHIREDPEVVGYVGCNECEIGIFKEKLLESMALPPNVLETRSLSSLTGGGERKRSTRRRRRTSRRRSHTKRNLH